MLGILTGLFETYGVPPCQKIDTGQQENITTMINSSSSGQPLSFGGKEPVEHSESEQETHSPAASHFHSSRNVRVSAGRVLPATPNRSHHNERHTALTSPLRDEACSLTAKTAVESSDNQPVNKVDEKTNQLFRHLLSAGTHLTACHYSREHYFLHLMPHQQGSKFVRKGSVAMSSLLGDNCLSCEEKDTILNRVREVADKIIPDYLW